MKFSVFYENIIDDTPFELFHMDLMGPFRTKSLGGKRYILVVVDDLSRYMWIELLKEKSEKSSLVKSLCKRLSSEHSLTISRVRSSGKGV